MSPQIQPNERYGSMDSKNEQTWLERLDEELNVDVDWMDTDYIKNMPIKPHDQTSNQLWVDVELANPANAALLRETARELKDRGWLAIYTRMRKAVLMCKKNIGYISGRALLQTLPSKAYDTQATIAHAELYDAEFSRAGISRDRYCIKIPSTGPALNAVATLSAKGIPTLGTAVFCLPQAVACSQANAFYISPYFNEKAAHDDRSKWPNVDDPATEHPMSPRVFQMLQVYRKLFKETGRDQPLMKNASYISAKEAMASGELGCHSATISHTVLNELAKLKYDGSKRPGEGSQKPKHAYSDATPVPERLMKLATVDPLSPSGFNATAARTDIDYLANGGAELARAIEADPYANRELAAALELFTAAENRSKEKVQKAMAEA
ncbi:transaldolase [Purpureocillium lavendulum]|uniref:Transaldolase n=1 Tax=Purpureocillium lavendulum TaxID=1247861 RepID=A0AB34FX38_9HYPO|nr:transaldolase [Purpureocillium lavendulum]